MFYITIISLLCSKRVLAQVADADISEFFLYILASSLIFFAGLDQLDIMFINIVQNLQS